MAKYDDLNTGAIALIGGVSTVLVVVIVLAVQVIYYSYGEQVEYARQINVPNFKADDVLAEQEQQLHSYGWIDKSKGVVSIDIERAKALVVREMRAEQEQDDAEDDVAATEGSERVR